MRARPRIRNPSLLGLLIRVKRGFDVKPRPAPVRFGPVQLAPYLNNTSAAASISADFELAWAWREWGVERAEKMGLLERKNVPLILELLDEFRVPITWATVGHLFLESCGGWSNGHGHPYMPRPPANRRWTGDWYQHDPCAHATSHPAWYCPDLIRAVQQGKVLHEIGSHSFSHIEFSRECSNAELVRAEIQECQKVMARFGIQPRTLIYPFNIMGHHYLELLSTFGVTVVRHRDQKYLLSYPERDRSGIYKIYETMDLRESTYYEQPAKALILLQQAVESGLCYHLWFHPSNPTDQFRGNFRNILQHMTCLRDSGQLWIATMKDLVAYSEARRTTVVGTSWNTHKMVLKLSSTYDSQRYGDSQLTLCVDCPTRPLRLTLFCEDNLSAMQCPDYRYEAEERVLFLNVPCRKDCTIELDFKES